MKHSFLLLLFVLFSIGCNKEEVPNNGNPTNNPSPQTTVTADAMNIVTGIQLQYIDGSKLFSVGNPNIKNDSIFVFPIPALNTLTVRSSTFVEAVWIMPATKEDTRFAQTDFKNLLNDMNYDMESNNVNQVFKANESTSSISVDVSTYETGYYRIFVEKSGSDNIHWDNLYINNASDYNAAVTQLRSEWD